MTANNVRTREESQSPSRAKRPQRTPLHSRDILHVRNKKSNKVYRWVNDVDERLFAFTQAGWEFVTDQGLEVGEPTVNATKEVGATIVKKVGNGIESYLMCIDKEFYDEDQKAKQERVDNIESTMYEQLNSSADGRYGKVKIGVNSED